MVAIGFSLLTYCLFVFGVWDFPNRTSAQLALWVLLFNGVMLAGFLVGTRTRKRPPAAPTQDARRTARFITRLIDVAFFVTLATFIPRLLIAAQIYDFEFDKLIARVQLGLNDALGAYQTRQATRPPGVWTYVNYICVATGFISWLYTPLAILFWDRFSVIRRLFTIVFWFAAVLSAICRGQNFGVFDLGIQITVFLLIRRYFWGEPRDSDGTQAKRKPESAHLRIGLGSFLVMITAIVSMIVFFSRTMESRLGNRYDRWTAFGGRYVAIDQNSWLWIACPDVLRPVSATFQGYLTHGYSGLELSLRMPFDSTVGLGNSAFLMDNFLQAFGTDLLPLTYQYKIWLSFDYHYSVLWHTAYTWIANDVSFWGVPIVLFLVLFIFGAAWRDFVLFRNLFGVLLIGPMATMFAFISANNQVMSNSASLGAMVVLTLLWLGTRNRYDWRGAFRLLGRDERLAKGKQERYEIDARGTRPTLETPIVQDR